MSAWMRLCQGLPTMELSFSDIEWGVGRAWFSFQDTEPEAFISVHVYPKSPAPLPGRTSFLRDSRVFSEEAQQTHKSIALCLWSVHQSVLFAEGITPGVKRNEMILGLAVTGAPHQPQESPREWTSAPFTLCSDHSCHYIQV